MSPRQPSRGAYGVARASLVREDQGLLLQQVTRPDAEALELAGVVRLVTVPDEVRHARHPLATSALHGAGTVKVMPSRLTLGSPLTFQQPIDSPTTHRRTMGSMEPFKQTCASRAKSTFFLSGHPFSSLPRANSMPAALTVSSSRVLLSSWKRSAISRRRHMRTLCNLRFQACSSSEYTEMGVAALACHKCPHFSAASIPASLAG